MGKNNDELIVRPFDYKTIGDKDVEGKLFALAASINRSRTTMVERMLEVGGELKQAHELLAGIGREGQFAPWLEAEFGYHRATAYRMMNAAIAFRKVSHSATLNLEVGAMYALAEPNIPDNVRREALRLAEKGKVTQAAAKALIQQFSQRQAPQVAQPDPEPPAELPEGLAEEVVEAVQSGKMHAEPEELAALARDYTHDSQVMLTESVVEGRQTLHDAIVSGEVPLPPIQDRMKQKTSKYEGLARQLYKFTQEILPSEEEDPYIHANGLYDSILSHVRAAGNSIRTVKPAVACPRCDAEGCDWCLGEGWLDKQKKALTPEVR